jgi:hypothetical protein
MLIRFLRAPEIRQAYSMYDSGEYGRALAFCTDQLSKPEADPELRLLRGVCHLDYGGGLTLDQAVTDWEECSRDHYYLGNFLRGRGEQYRETAWRHFEQAVAKGWVEGHIGMGFVLLLEGLALFEDDAITSAAESLLRRAVTELGMALTSPAPASRKRALSLRSDALYHLGDVEGSERENEAERRIVVGEPQPDPRSGNGSQVPS